MSAYITSGILGIEQRQELGCCDYRYFLDELDEGVRSKFDVVEVMPSSLLEALDKLERDALGLDVTIGVEMVNVYQIAKRGELRKLQKLDIITSKSVHLKHF